MLSCETLAHLNLNLIWWMINNRKIWVSFTFYCKQSTFEWSTYIATWDTVLNTASTTLLRGFIWLGIMQLLWKSNCLWIIRGHKLYNHNLAKVPSPKVKIIVVISSLLFCFDSKRIINLTPRGPGGPSAATVPGIRGRFRVTCGHCNEIFVVSLVCIF